MMSLWTGKVQGRAWRADLRNSVLYRPMDILGGLCEDAYAFTHLLMYCTDFGFRPGNLPRPRSAILAEAGSLLAKYLDEENYDLAGEVIMAWPLTGARWSASATFAFRVLASIEDRVGVLPIGVTKFDRLNKLQGKERTQYALGTAYHTAYVMGLLCAASLLPGRAPSTRVKGTPVERSFLDRLLLFIDRDQGHWQAEFSALAEFEQRALAPLVIDIAIAQKLRKHDYAALSELLVAASEFGMARSPLCGQAAELLGRLSACSQMVQAEAGVHVSAAD